MADTVWNGQGTLVSPTTGAGVRVKIASVTTSGGQTEVQTSSAHGFYTSDSVEIEGTSTVCDGQFQITVVDSTHFILNGTSGGSLGAQGYVIDYETQPAYQLAANGSLADANDLLTALEGLSNPVPFLYRRAGKWRLYNQYQVVAGNFISLPMNTNPWSTNTGFSSSSVTPLASATFTFESVSDLPSGPPPVFATGDMLVLSLSLTAQVNNSTGGQAGVAQIGFGLVQGGSLLSTIGSPAVLVEAQSTVLSAVPLNLSGSVTIANGSGGLVLPSSALSFCIFARLDVAPASGSFNLNLIGPLTGTINQYRAN